MKKILQQAREKLEPLGFRMTQKAFFRIETGIYELVDFQRGAHGGGYFFVNLCIHPLGLPSLDTKDLIVPTTPKEYECIVRQRLEQIVDQKGFQRLRKGSFQVKDDDALAVLLDALRGDTQTWFRQWADFVHLANASEEVLSPMLTVVPNLKRKAFFMLQFFCQLKCGQMSTARQTFARYVSTRVGNYDFSHIDKYLASLPGS